MKRIGRSLLILTILLLELSFGTGLSPAQATSNTSSGVGQRGLAAGGRHRNIAINLGDFVSVAQLSTPPVGHGPWPTVILFHGSGPWDMDSTYRDRPGGPVLAANFKLLAERLGQKGIAVLRFNKRGVRSDGSHDSAQIARATTNQLIQDAQVVIKAARDLPEVHHGHLFLYGWSQGAQVATHAAAAEDRRIAGVILQGPSSSGWSSILNYQLIVNGLPALRRADTDHDGQLSIPELIALPPGPAVLFLRLYLWALSSTPELPKLNPRLDQNHDDKLNIETEIQPFFQAFVTDPTRTGSPFLDPKNEPAQQIDDVFRTSQLRALVLSGNTDGLVPPRDAFLIKASAPGRVQLRRYPGLGHALSPTTDPSTDTFGVMDDKPIRDVINWVTRRSR